jgi:hypothetical protein
MPEDGGGEPRTWLFSLLPGVLKPLYPTAGVWARGAPRPHMASTDAGPTRSAGRAAREPAEPPPQADRERGEERGGIVWLRVHGGLAEAGGQRYLNLGCGIATSARGPSGSFPGADRASWPHPWQAWWPASPRLGGLARAACRQGGGVCPLARAPPISSPPAARLSSAAGRPASCLRDRISGCGLLLDFLFRFLLCV